MKVATLDLLNLRPQVVIIILESYIYELRSFCFIRL